MYVWPASKARETASLFACTRWCARDLMAEIATTTDENVVFSYCEQTQVQEKYHITEE